MKRRNSRLSLTKCKRFPQTRSSMQAFYRICFLAALALFIGLAPAA